MDFTRIVFVLTLIEMSHCFKILLMPFHVGSHILLMANLGRQLVENGNDVHVLLMENPESEEVFRNNGVKIVKYKTRRLTGEDNKAWIDQSMDEFITLSMKGTYGSIKAVEALMHTMEEEGKIMLENKELMETISKMNYDIVVVDGVPYNLYHYLIPYKYDIPFVTLSTSSNHFTTGVPHMTSFVPSEILPFSDQMTFVQRLINFLIELFHPQNRLKSPMSELVKRFAPDPETDLNQIQSTSGLFIQLSAPPLDYPRPSLPHVVSVPSLTIRKPVLIKDESLASFVNGAPEGFILFSLGTITNKHLPTNIINIFLTIFSSIPQRIIWNYDSTQIKVIAKNIKFMKWLPQNDLLGHPNIRLFITHCGNAGQHESLYHGVPMLGIPIHSDQPHNAVRLIRYKYGLVINIENATEDSIANQVSELLNNPVYKTNAQKASAIMKDNVMLPVQRAAYWIEHMTRFGSDHLRSPGLDLHWYQYWMIDVLCLLLIVFIIFIYLFIKVTKTIVVTVRKMIFKYKVD